MCKHILSILIVLLTSSTVREFKYVFEEKKKKEKKDDS